MSLFSCEGTNFFSKAATPLQIEDVNNDNNSDNDKDPLIPQDLDINYTGTRHAMFTGNLGQPISRSSMGAIDPDPTGHTANNDYDGDGIPNNQEIITNPFVADYPKIVTRISAPITMEIRVDENTSENNHTEIIEDSDLQKTITNSMEDKHYSQLNQKTTPYRYKTSTSDSNSNDNSYGHSDASSNSLAVSFKYKAEAQFIGTGGGTEVSGSVSGSSSRNHSENYKLATSLAKSRMTETTQFKDVNYMDNLDRNGVSFKDDTVERISQNFRKNLKTLTSLNVGPNNGVVRASLYIKNITVNMPVRISDVVCTLTFRTQSGEFLPVKTFTLKNENYSEFNEEVYGNEELGPYTIEVTGLNTNEVKKALANGYIPQIHVVSYKLNRVSGSNYNPGVDNLKIVEENTKGRTATIKIIGNGIRETYRVTAFDVDDNGDISPGVSLKKALYRIYRDQTGGGEKWKTDADGNVLTVGDDNLRWKPNTTDRKKYDYTINNNTSGNKWRLFETYVKKYTDAYNNVQYIETIKRIGNLKKYNPFNPEDNSNYSPNELLTKDEVMQTKYWVILQNGKYFEGDINDPIWVGERFEIICFDANDFQKHYETYTYNPFQTNEKFNLETRWNRLNQKDNDEFSRAIYLGKVLASDVVHLQVDLTKTRFLFQNNDLNNGFGNPTNVDSTDNYYNYKYNFEPDEKIPEGIPGEFDHTLNANYNSLSVYIKESINALRYVIDITSDDTSFTAKTITVTREELKEKDNFIYINRMTPVIKDSTDLVGYLPGGTYEVKVTAYGTYDGTEVSTASLTNLISERKVIIENPAGSSSIPTAFTFDATGLKNQIVVTIGQSNFAEYYIIEYTGPTNSTHSASSTTTQILAHSGNNYITIKNPPTNLDVAGLYKVKVYAYNNNQLSGVQSSNEKYVQVSYEKFENQKLYRGLDPTQLFKNSAVHLEVNFNDGTGWYRLVMSYDQMPGAGTAKWINCQYTSYIEYNKQKFHIYFQAPKGDEYSSSNVFTGGREVADVYIRTVAKEEFRDRFWPKPKINDGIISEPGSYNDSDVFLSVNGGTTDVLKKWINLPGTDATFFNETIIENGDTTIGDFTLSNATKDNFFFAPAEHRTYAISASLEYDMPDTAGNKPVMDSFLARRLENKNFEVYDIKASGAPTKFIVSYRPGMPQSLQKETVTDDDLSKIDVFGPQWTFKYIEINSANPDLTNDITKDLVKNTEYLVAVVAVNEYGQSAPVFFRENLLSDNKKPDLIMTVSNVKPELAPQSVSLSLGVDGKSIIVNNIHVPGEIRYQVLWREKDSDPELESSWTVATVPNIAPGYSSYPVSHTIDGLKPWTDYVVKTRAVTMNNPPIEGTDSTSMQIQTKGIYTDGQVPPKMSSLHVATAGSGADLQIHVNNILLRGITKYEVVYKTDGQTDDEWSDPIVVIGNGLDPVSTIIDSALAWDKYQIMVRAVNGSGVVGEYSDVYVISTVPEANVITGTAAWINHKYNGIYKFDVYNGFLIDYKKLDAELLYSFYYDQLPAGTVSIEISSFKIGSKTVPGQTSVTDANTIGQAITYPNSSIILAIETLRGYSPNNGTWPDQILFKPENIPSFTMYCRNSHDELIVIKTAEVNITDWDNMPVE